MPRPTPLPFCSCRGYRRWTARWWAALGDYLIRGVWQDMATYWHRARYGWAPRDTWSLDLYLSQVFAGSLAHLADHASGYPAGYRGASRTLPAQTEWDSDDLWDEARAAAWSHDLHRWSRAFADLLWWEDEGDRAMYAAGVPTQTRIALERWYTRRAQRAWRDMIPHFRSLWD